MVQQHLSKQQQQPQAWSVWFSYINPCFQYYFSLLITAEVLTTHFHIKMLQQVEAHLPPSSVPAILHNTVSKEEAIEAAAPLQPFPDWCRISSDRLWTRSATAAFHLEVSTWHVEVFGIPQVWLSAQLHNLSRDNLLLTRREGRMSTDNPFYVRGHLLPRHVPAEAALLCQFDFLLV